IPYPSFESSDDLSVYALSNGKWKLKKVSKVDKKRKTFTMSTRYFETYRLVETAAQANSWDVNRDEAVDILDLVRVSNAFGAQGLDAYADVDRSGAIDILDLTLVAKHFGERYDSVAAAPVIKLVAPRADISMSIETIETIEAVSSLAQVSLSINVVLNEQLKGFQFDLKYDPNLLDVIGVEEGNVFQGSSFWVEPQLLDGRVEKVASVEIGSSDESVTATTAKMATVTFQPKVDINHALKSIHLENLKLSDSKASLIPVRIKSIDNLNQLVDSNLSFSLGQNYPNPFNPETWIPYLIEENQAVTIRIYSAAGKLVRELDLGFKSAGSYISRHKAAYWDGRNLRGEEVASGIYFYELEAGKFNATKKMIILK
ncbi:MAG: T9SS type A sorting domain-containing protein, partial [Candidatus Poribacteria bacterium]|nr:T9SS type A sorting domain-containing protein [Candidatus Poribacteria bacterium]